jgi:NAD(P)-dependent dehydrogenase (short-subunit alcohol dehydrogenase family)
LTGKRAAVTGAARGIGFEIARGLCRAGARVTIGDLRKQPVDEAVARLRAEGLDAAGCVADVSRLEDNVALANAAVGDDGRLDIWVCNAGVFPHNDTASMSAEQWRHVIDINLNGAYFGAQSAFRVMPGGGVIIFVASTGAFRPKSDGRAHYAASKFGVRGLTTALAREWGPHKVRVNAVAPGYVPTEGATEHLGDPTPDGVPNDVFMTRGVPLGRASTPEDIANAVLFCVSDMASNITGVVLPVDGGLLVA